MTATPLISLRVGGVASLGARAAPSGIAKTGSILSETPSFIARSATLRRPVACARRSVATLSESSRAWRIVTGPLNWPE